MRMMMCQQRLQRLMSQSLRSSTLSPHLCSSAQLPLLTRPRVQRHSRRYGLIEGTLSTVRHLSQSSTHSHSRSRPYQYTQPRPQTHPEPSNPVSSAHVLSNSRAVTSIYHIPNPTQTNPAEFISKLPKLNDVTRANLTNALFLVTPQLAQWFERDSPILQRAMDKLYSPIPQALSPMAFVAVVDGLPGPEYFADASWNQATAPYASIEGVAVYISHNVRSTALREGEARGTGLIRIMSGMRNPPESIDAGSETDVMGTTLSIPVANTLFLNGKESTLFGTVWKVSRSGELAKTYYKAFDLNGVAVALGTLPQRLFDVHLPLHELTRPRRVLSSMGNVIREVEGDDGKSLRASAELEAEVPKFLARMKEEGNEAQIQVFARVVPVSADKTPQSRFSAQNAEPVASEDNGSKMAFDDLWHDCRLYRVTSGGGGWGKKAGLLSLDPATNFDPPKSSESGMFPDPDADEPAFGSLTNIGALVTTDRTIQFLAAKVQEAIPSSQLSGTARRVELSKKKKWLFGNFSQAEAEQTMTAPENARYTRMKVFPGCFGAFSHNGIALALHKRVSSNASTLTDTSKKFQYKLLNEFRIDAPFVTFKATTQTKADAAFESRQTSTTSSDSHETR